MTYEFKAERAPTYVHVTGAGSNTSENMMRFLIDANRAAVEHNSDTLLLEMKFSGPSLDFASIYSVISARSPTGSLFKRIAYVDLNKQQSDDRAEFATLAANNRGVNVRLFRNLTEAQRWLENSPGV